MLNKILRSPELWLLLGIVILLSILAVLTSGNEGTGEVKMPQRTEQPATLAR